ncbi:uncharacterized low-complexity proteins [Longilinea arvoryzae]|uniref:Uncharacterized low-complexity proteins n=1 Tax=Longilinea arvoryzae TaxID=360412 RepID=A0A0S7BDM1_9CHLR|nr:pentapeptide repeat-containing protein [Longilinea arvoryzae]GAP12454.1 uncharacterized low-complexity proteins [Longilinea arvoryzae]
MKSGSGGDLRPPKLPIDLTPIELAGLYDENEFSQASLSGDCSDQSAAGLLFEQCAIRRVNLLNTHFSGLRVYNCRLDHCDLSGAQWEEARLRRTEWVDCRLRGASLIDSRCEDVNFSGCSMDDAFFAGVIFRAARFTRCSLRKVNFEGADLSGVIFDQCDLSGAKLPGAKLKGADLRSSNIEGMQVGIADLGGVKVTMAQALQVAALLGIVIREVGEEDNPPDPQLLP